MIDRSTYRPICRRPVADGTQRLTYCHYNVHVAATLSAYADVRWPLISPPYWSRRRYRRVQFGRTAQVRSDMNSRQQRRLPLGETAKRQFRVELWPQLGLDGDLQASFVAGDPQALGELTTALEREPTLARLQAAGLLLAGAPVDRPKDLAVAAAQMIAALDHAGARGGADEQLRCRVLAIDGQLKNMLGTLVAHQCTSVRRMRLLFEDATNELRDAIDEFEELEVTLDAIGRHNRGGPGWPLRRLHLRVHSYASTAISLNEYARAAQRAVGQSLSRELVDRLAEVLHEGPYARLIRGLRNVALHQQGLPLVPFVRTGEGHLRGSVFLEPDRVRQLGKNWGSALSLLEDAAPLIDLSEIVTGHADAAIEVVDVFLLELERTHSTELDAAMKFHAERTALYRRIARG